MLYHIIIKCLCQLTLLTLVIKTQSVTLSFVKKRLLELSFTQDFNSQIWHENTKKHLAMDNMFINGVHTFAPVQPFFLVWKYRIVVRKYGGIVFCTATPN